MALSFLWHDYETFGLSPKRDRPAQFAAIRTDGNLQEIGEPVNWHCQPGRDYLPDPVSCLLTGITPQHCRSVGLPEAIFASQIEGLLAEPGTVGVGYNSLRFDDEFTRYLFWRNLIDPYAREWKNQCGRWDILDMVRTVYALRPDTLVWPRKEDGSVSFKLELLTAANGLAHEAAHDALSDVRATIALARLILQRQPKLFDFCLALRKKDRVLSEIKWPLQRPFLHVSGRFSAARGCLGVMWPLAQHPHNRNELICWDLAYSPSVLEGMDAEQIRHRLFGPTDQLPKDQSRLPIKTIHINKSPVVIGNRAIVTPELESRWGLDLALAYQVHAPQAAQLVLHPDLWSEVYLPFQSASGETPDVDEDLYGGFTSDNDKRRLDRLRSLAPTHWGASAQAFEDERLIELAFRYQARNDPASLTPEQSQQWQLHCEQRLNGTLGTTRTWADYTRAIDNLALTATAEQQSLLSELKAYHP